MKKYIEFRYLILRGIIYFLLQCSIKGILKFFFNYPRTIEKNTFNFLIGQCRNNLFFLVMLNKKMSEFFFNCFRLLHFPLRVFTTNIAEKNYKKHMGLISKLLFMCRYDFYQLNKKIDTINFKYLN